MTTTTTGCFNKKDYTLGKSMSTTCCQSLRSKGLVVSGCEVPGVWFPGSVCFFLKHNVVLDD